MAIFFKCVDLYPELCRDLKFTGFFRIPLGPQSNLVLLLQQIASPPFPHDRLPWRCLKRRYEKAPLFRVLQTSDMLEN